MDFQTNKGIYKITCLATGKFYIGSSINLKRRRFYHFYELRNNKHANVHMQKAYNKYGSKNFVFEVIEFFLETCTQKEALIVEQKYLNGLKPYNHKIGFNMSKFAGRPTQRKGFKHSKETLELYSRQRKGKKKSENFKQTLSRMYKGKSMKERTNDPNWISQRTGKTMKEITGDPNWVDPKIGKSRPPELIKKLSEERQGTGNPSYNPELVTLKHKNGTTYSKTRYEWRNEYGITVSKLLSGKLKSNYGWSLLNQTSGVAGAVAA